LIETLLKAIITGSIELLINGNREDLIKEGESVSVITSPMLINNNLYNGEYKGDRKLECIRKKFYAFALCIVCNLLAQELLW
jgi:hypothetical protein